MLKKLLCILLSVLTVFSVSSVTSCAMSYSSESAVSESYENDGSYSESSVTTKDGEVLSFESFKKDMEELGGLFGIAALSSVFGILFYGMFLLVVPLEWIGLI